VLLAPEQLLPLTRNPPCCEQHHTARGHQPPKSRKSVTSHLWQRNSPLYCAGVFVLSQAAKTSRVVFQATCQAVEVSTLPLFQCKCPGRVVTKPGFFNNARVQKLCANTLSLDALLSCFVDSLSGRVREVGKSVAQDCGIERVRRVQGAAHEFPASIRESRTRRMVISTP
jgi:hypothetical protein